MEKGLLFSKFVSLRLKYKHADQYVTEIYEVKCDISQPPPPIRTLKIVWLTPLLRTQF
jgi:hypothetical protein